jgi:hypothetical protein
MDATPHGPERTSGGSSRWLALAAVAVAVVIAVFTPDHGSHLRSVRHFHNFLHVPGLGLVAVLLLAAFPARAGVASGRRARLLLAVFGATVAVGVLVELLQALAGRGASAEDIVRDAAGAAAVVLVVASSGPAVRTGARWFLRGVAVLLVAAFALPMIAALLEERRARGQFPVLADFGRAVELERFEWIHSTPDWSDPGAGRRGVRVTLWPERYPGFALEYFPRDWRGYRHFVFTATNPSAEPLPVTLRVEDMRHNQRYSDRFNARYVLAPGRNEIRVPLAAVELAPAGRAMDLSRIHRVIIFSANLRAPRELIVESLRLEKGD